MTDSATIETRRRITNLVGTGQFEVTFTEPVALRPGEVLLEILSTGICGTDLKIFSGKKTAPRLADGTSVLGHEFVGGVVAHRCGPEGPPVGARVFVEPDLYCGLCAHCQAGATNMCTDAKVIFEDYPGSFADYLVVPQQAVTNGQVHVLPDELSSDEGALVEPLACVLHGQSRLLRVLPLRRTACILGGGPIGAMHALAARVNGFERVVIADINQPRVEMLSKMMAPFEEVSCVSLDPTEGGGQLAGLAPFDMVVQACPDVSALRAGFDMLAPSGGLLAFAGVPRGEEASFPAHPLHYGDRIVMGSANYVAQDITRALELLTTKEIPGDALISSSYPLSEIQKAMGFAQSGLGLKVMLRPQQG